MIQPISVAIVFLLSYLTSRCTITALESFLVGDVILSAILFTILFLIITLIMYGRGVQDTCIECSNLSQEDSTCKKECIISLFECRHYESKRSALYKKLEKKYSKRKKNGVNEEVF